MTPEILGFAALKHAPSSILVLSGSTKQIVFCNYAMEKLFNSVQVHAEKDNNQPKPSITADSVKGRRLAEMGIGLLQEGSAVFIEFGWTRLYQISCFTDSRAG